MISSLTNEERKRIFSKINEKDDGNKNELNVLNKYIEKNRDNAFFKFHIENMVKEDIILLINYIKNNFNLNDDENNY